MEKYRKHSLPPHILPLSSSACHQAGLQIGFCIARCTEGGVEKKEKKKKMQAQHANQVFPLLALGSKDSSASGRVGQLPRVYKHSSAFLSSSLPGPAAAFLHAKVS